MNREPDDYTIAHLKENAGRWLMLPVSVHERSRIEGLWANLGFTVRPVPDGIMVSWPTEHRP